MILLSLKVPPLVGTKSDWKRILPRFQREAGNLVVQAIQDVLGSSDIYELKPSYSAKKIAGKVARLKRISGKAADQPLILTGEMYNALQWRKVGDVLIIEIADGKAIHGDTDYAAMWDEKTQFMEQGLAAVEDQLDELLLNIIFSEMGL